MARAASILDDVRDLIAVFTKIWIDLGVHMSVRPEPQTQPFVGRQKPPQRHQTDDKVRLQKLRSVRTTSASWSAAQLPEVDATEVSKRSGYLLAVKQTDAATRAAFKLT